MVRLRLNLIKIIHQNPSDCIIHLKKVLGEHAPEPLNISVADITIYFFLKLTIFYSEFFQNT